MPPTLSDRVCHILDAIDAIDRALIGKSREDYAGDLILRLAVERLLEIVCEASRHIPRDAKAREPAIAWDKMIDFGNRLRHAYHRVDADIVWTVVTDDLPPLKAFVERVEVAHLERYARATRRARERGVRMTEQRQAASAGKIVLGPHTVGRRQAAR